MRISKVTAFFFLLLFVTEIAVIGYQSRAVEALRARVEMADAANEIIAGWLVECQAEPSDEFEWPEVDTAEVAYAQ